MNAEEWGEFKGEVYARLDTLAKGQEEIKLGLWGETGLEPRLRKVEESQAGQKAYVASAGVLGTVIGGIITFLGQLWWNR